MVHKETLSKSCKKLTHKMWKIWLSLGKVKQVGRSVHTTCVTGDAVRASESKMRPRGAPRRWTRCRDGLSSTVSYDAPCPLPFSTVAVGDKAVLS